jgi:8-amino-7-oxononanoate synthase
VTRDARAIGARLAGLIGCPAAALAPSTLHLFLDLFDVLADEHGSVHVDAGAYPIARWGAERVQLRGIPTQTFGHHDPAALGHQLARPGSRRPLILADGYCPGCGPAPLDAYAQIASRFHGRLVIDDSQAVGILGGDPGPYAPLGRGGGGSLRRHGLTGSPVVVGASLAKAFGVPVAVLAGPPDVVGRFEQAGPTRVHCSPPSAAVVNAAQHALELNRQRGDAARARLVAVVERFRARARAAGLPLRGGLFPVQTIATTASPRAVDFELRRRGIRAVLHRDHAGREQVSFVLGVRHDEAAVDAAVAALVRAHAAVSGGAGEGRGRWLAASVARAG